MQMMMAFWRDKSAATSIEYAMIAFFASIALVAGATSIGVKLNARFAPIAANLT